METSNKLEENFFVVALKEEARTILWEVGSDTDPQTLINSCLEDLQALAPREPEFETRSEKEIWDQVRRRLLKAAYADRAHCIRCGTCCTKGSPILVQRDLELLKDSPLKPEHLMTIRKGELVYSNRTDSVSNAAEEFIKINEQPESRTCIFYESWDKSCGIYESRPSQCREQECWNVERNEGHQEELPLDRQALLGTMGALWALIQSHEERCSHAEFSRVMARLKATKGETISDLLEMLRFDDHARWFMTEKLNLAPSSLNFFLGRPLSDLLKTHGLKVERQPDETFFVSPL